MPDTPSITIVKRFTYRGKPEETSNKYHFSGTTPGSPAAWFALAKSLVMAERQCVTNRTAFVRAYGHEAGNEVAVWLTDFATDPSGIERGVLTPATNAKVLMQPESAATIRWSTGERNSRNKFIYLRKYMHDGLVNGADGETLEVGYKGALQTWAEKLIDGTHPGGFKYCGPQGAVAQAPEVNPFAVSRELKRRGKRPSR